MGRPVKYIMLETAEGQKLPVIFPDALTHCFVAGAMQLVMDTLDPKKDLRPKQLLSFLERPSAPVTSAGFINLGVDISVYGESESLGGVKSKPADAVRIICGEAIQFMPDEMAEMLLEKLRADS
jgi:hypothetical protein